MVDSGVTTPKTRSGIPQGYIQVSIRVRIYYLVSTQPAAILSSYPIRVGGLCINIVGNSSRAGEIGSADKNTHDVVREKEKVNTRRKLKGVRNGI